MTPRFHFDAGQPIHWRYLPWNAGKAPQQFSATDGKWLAEHDDLAEAHAIDAARKLALQDWIKGK